MRSSFVAALMTGLLVTSANGGKVDVVSLPERGIKGNSHMMMMDKNNRAVLDVIAKWLVDNGMAEN